MEDLDKSRIQRNLPFLCENTNNVLIICTILISKSIFSFEEMQEVMAKQTKTGQNAHMFNLLMSKGPTAMEILLQALKDSGNQVIADKLTLDSDSPPEPENIDRFAGLFWFECSSPVGNFTGRSLELKKLSEMTSSIFGKRKRKVGVVSDDSKKSKKHYAILCGLGGVGKTELARHFARSEFQNETTGHAIWINGETESAAIASYKRLADELKISLIDSDGNEKSLATLMKDVIKKFQGEKYIMIFDNVEEFKGGPFELYHDAIANQAPNFQHPFVLITSRNRKLLPSGEAELIEVDVFSAPVSREFLEKSFLDQDQFQVDPTEADELGQLLQYLPLTLQQAVSYIKEERHFNAAEQQQDQGVSVNFGIRNYIELFENEKRNLLKHASNTFLRSNTYTLTTYATWRVTIAKIEKLPMLGRVAVDILNRIAYFSPDHIETKVVFDYYTTLLDPVWFVNPESDPSAKFKLAITNLVSGLRKAPGFTAVHEAVANRMDEMGLETTLSELGIHRVIVDFQPAEDELLHAMPILKKYSMIKLEEGIMSIHRMVQEVIRLELNDSTDAPPPDIYILKEMLQSFRAQIIKSTISKYSARDCTFVDHVIEVWKYVARNRMVKELHDIFTSMSSNIVYVLHALLRHNDEINFSEYAIQILEPILGTGAELVLKLKFQQLKAFLAKERFKECKDLYDNGLYSDCIKYLGENDVMTLNLDATIASALISLGNHKDGIDLLMTTTAKLEQIFGSSHKFTLAPKRLAVGIYVVLGRIGEAVSLGREIIPLVEATFGSEAEETICLKLQISLIEEFHNNTIHQDSDDSLSMYDGFLDIQKKDFGGSHPGTLAAAMLISGKQLVQGKYKESCDGITQVVKIMLEYYEPDSQNVLECKSIMGFALEKSGRLMEPLQVHTEVIESCSSAKLPDTNQVVLFAKSNLGSTLLTLNRFPEAVDLLQDIHEKHGQVFGFDHPASNSLKCKLACGLAKLGRCEEAYGILEQIETSSPQLQFKANFLKAGFLCDEGKCVESYALAEEVRQAQEVCFGPKHPDSLATRSLILGLHLILKNFDNAVTFGNELEKDAIETLGGLHPISLAIQGNLAGALYNQSRFEESIELNRLGLTARQQIFPENHPELRTTLMNLGLALFHGNLNDASQCTEALKIIQECHAKNLQYLGQEHPITQWALEFMTQIHEHISTLSGEAAMPASSATSNRRRSI